MPAAEFVPHVVVAGGTVSGLGTLLWAWLRRRAARLLAEQSGDHPAAPTTGTPVPVAVAETHAVGDITDGWRALTDATRNERDECREELRQTRERCDTLEQRSHLAERRAGQAESRARDSARKAAESQREASTARERAERAETACRAMRDELNELRRAIESGRLPKE